MSAILTRRSGLVVPVGGVAPIAPDAVTGLQGWWKADAIAQADNSAVATWPGSHGSRDLVQAGGGSQPSFQTNEQNTLPVVRFTDAGHDLESAALLSDLIAASAFSIFVAIKCPFSANAMAFKDGSEYLTLPCVSVGTLWQINNWDVGAADYDTASVLGTANAWQVVSAQHGAGTIRIRVNGGTDATASSGDTEDLTSTVKIRGVVGDVGELIVYNAAVSAGNRAGIEAYLADRWQ